MSLRLFPGLTECHAEKEAWCVPRGAGIPPVATLLAQHAGLIEKGGSYHRPTHVPLAQLQHLHPALHPPGPHLCPGPRPYLQS